jgi:hypothetical protein
MRNLITDCLTWVEILAGRETPAAAVDPNSLQFSFCVPSAFIWLINFSLINYWPSFHSNLKCNYSSRQLLWCSTTFLLDSARCGEAFRCKLAKSDFGRQRHLPVSLFIRRFTAEWFVVWTRTQKTFDRTFKELPNGIKFNQLDSTMFQPNKKERSSFPQSSSNYSKIELMTDPRHLNFQNTFRPPCRF